jgi:hypothetical protein
VVVVGVVEVKCDLSLMVVEEWQQSRCLRLLVSSKHSPVGHVGVPIYEGIVRKR